MKRFLCVLIAVSMLISCITVFADDSTSKAMEEVLVEVKQKVDIPEKLTEFVPYTTITDSETNYSFLWQDKDGKAYIEVSADSQGRINRYYTYDGSLKSDKKLTVLSKEDILKFAEDFLRKTVPEAFAENDRLVFDEDSWNVDNLTYSLSYVRMRGGIEVKDNFATVRVAVYDDVAYIRNMSISYNYDAKFEAPETVIEDYEEQYKKAFPAELIYTDEYNGNRSNAEDVINTVLIYRFKDNKAGYISASTGEIVVEDSTDDKGILFGGSGSASKETAADLANRKNILTEQEIGTLEEIDGLISKDDAAQILKKLPHLNFDSEMKLSYYNISLTDNEYLLSLAYENEDKERYISATINGNTGEVLYLYNRVPYSGNDEKEELTEAQKKEAETGIDEFLKIAASDKLKHFSSYDKNVQGKSVSCDYNRVVMGVKYISDSIFVEFDAASGMVANYCIDYEEEREFKSPDGVISKDDAFKKITDISPIKQIYVKNNGVYKVCYTASEYSTQVDAFSGERYLAYGKTGNTDKYEYSDIDGHWAENAVNKLAEVQIGFEGEKFKPDEPIAQYDLLRLFASGVRYKFYLDYSEEDLYRELIDEGILTVDEKNCEGKVMREDACVYMIRLAGLEDVAKLSDIFKVEYTDQSLLSQGKIGYPAILSGMGVICGYDGSLRPKDPITRAEAAVMVYNYMMK